MSDAIRTAIVGGAGMWGRYYLKAMVDNPRCQIVGFVDRNAERRREFAEHYGIAPECEFDDLADLFARQVPQAVAAILPVQHTVDTVLACVEAGVKAVTVEKPIAAQLAQADAAVDACRAAGVALGCGTAYWEVPFLQETAAWVAEGRIGALTGAAIPGGLPREVSGAGCVQLTMLRLLSGMEVEWVEGWVQPPEPGWVLPDGAEEHELDCPAYGRLGLSGGIVCEIPPPVAENEVPCRVAVTGTDGQVWAQGPESVFIKGSGAASTPVRPEFLRQERPGRTMGAVVERLMEAVETGAAEVACSGHDYRQALEIALALKLSAREGNRRVHLPLEDRSGRIFPHPYRLVGGDVAGYESIGYEGPPQIERRVKRSDA